MEMVAINPDQDGSSASTDSSQHKPCMSGAGQLKTLMWKNFILRYKRERFFLLELGVPLLLGSLLFVIFDGISATARELHTYLPSNSSFLSSQNLQGTVINYIPKSIMTDKLMAVIEGFGASVQGFRDLREYLEEYVSYPALPLIVFKDMDVLASNMPKKLRFQLLDQNFTLHLASVQMDTTVTEIFESQAIATTQKLVTEAFITYWIQTSMGTGVECQLEIGLLKMSHTGQLPSSQALANLFSIIIICSCVPISMNIIRVILSERQSNFKEVMQLHNVSEEVYWLSWCLVGAFGFLIIEMAIILTVTVSVQYLYMIPKTNLFIVMTLIILHAINNTSSSFLVASYIINEATRTYVVVLVVPLILYMLASASMVWMTQALHVILGVTVFQVAFCMSVAAITDMEYEGEGYTLSNFTESPVSRPGLFSCMQLMVLNTVFNLFWMWYFNKIQPTYYAEQLFCLLCLQRTDSSSINILKRMPKPTHHMEPDPMNQTPAVKLHKVAKCSQDEIIVAETTMNIYDEEITVILGPSGPDKSALIGMITGLMLPTHGTIMICGFNVLLNRRKAQENIGLCPRYDVLFNKLTCMEHLKFFFNLKGIEVNESEVMELLIGIQMGDKALTKTEELSPYEKRLLSLATATIGDPKVRDKKSVKVVILDEPSKDLSLAEQRQLWSILKTLQSSRAILVTTINVGEAEALADRTAVIIDGHVKCYGSQMFLKHNYGVGYQLRIVKKKLCRSDKVTIVVMHILPSASLQEESETELRYYLPHDAVGKFSNVLKGLENHANILNIESVSIQSTTMDEIFVKVQRGFDPVVNTTSDEDLSNPAKKKGRKHSKKSKKQKQEKGKNDKSNKNVNSNVDNRTHSDDKLDVHGQTGSSAASGAAKQKHPKGKMNINSLSVPDNSLIAGKSHSSNSLSYPLSDDRSASLDTFVNMELKATPSRSVSVDEYAYAKPYTFTPGDQSRSEKMKAICIKSILVTRRRWIVTILQTGTPSLLLMAGLILDMQGHYSGQTLSNWYTTDKIPRSRVQIITANNTRKALIDIYEKLLTTEHVPVLFQFDKLKDSGLHSASSEESPQNSRDDYIGVDFTNELYRHGVAMYNIHMNHAMAISLQLLLNTNVRDLLGHDYSVSSGLVTVEDLLHQTGKILCPTTTLGLNLGLVIFSVVTINTLISDRRSRRKQILQLYGVTPVLYWLSTFAWDMAVYTVLVACVMVVLCLDKVVFIDDGRWVVVLLFLYLSAVAFLSEVYILQKLFDVQTNGILVIVILHVFTGVCGSFALLFAKYTRTTPDYLLKYTYVLGIVLEIFSPLYSYTAVILPFPALVTVLRTQGEFKDYFDNIEFNGVVINLYRPLIVLMCQSVFCWTVILLTDSISIQQLSGLGYDIGNKLPGSPFSMDIEDDDSMMEKERVKMAVFTNSMFEATLVLQNLRKCYGKLVAVEGTCLILHKGDCFGLLGPSGSGKSSTLQMITGMEPVTSGSVFVMGYSVQDYLPQVRNLISFTPQYSCLWPHLTGRETLVFFGRLRGIPDAHLHDEVEVLLDVLTLGELADSTVASYGASKQRLLSIAVGFLGKPVMVILDEPSYGLDTVEKKALWTMMKKVADSQSTVLFTSESVEECETVCTKMAIQVAGRLKCLGSPYHLKTRYAMGYTIVLYQHPAFSNEHSTDKLVDHMQATFPGIAVCERNVKQLHFRIPYCGEKLYDIFHNLKTVKKKFHLDNYMVHETTLEQVYLSFTLGHHVKPMKLIPKKKTVRWAEGTKDVVNTIPNKYSSYQIQKKTSETKSSISTDGVANFFKRFSLYKE